MARAQTTAIDLGAGFLEGSQGVDGAWPSSQVRRLQATTEALRALQVTGRSPAARAAAADLLEVEAILDTDDRSRRVEALSLEGRDVSGELSDLLADASEDGGWGLSARFGSEALDSSLALQALAAAGEASRVEAFLGLVDLVAKQKSDGGWSCTPFGESEVSCTASSLLALASYRGLFNLETQIARAAVYLNGQFQADGGFAAASLDRLYATAVGARALLSVNDELPGRRALVTAFLENAQQADGSWENDPFLTAAVVRALHAIAITPFCGDGFLNTAREACDAIDLGGATCEAVGFGPGTLACNASCQFDTSSCAPPPVCGDGAINQPSEACDGFDLGGLTCETLGFGGGDLLCSDRCTFDTDECLVLPVCGDDLINQASEACDGADLGGASCGSLGLGGGNLACRSTCRFDASGCTAEPMCGDGVINSPLERCDGSDVGGLTCESFGGSGPLGCRPDCIGFDINACADLPDDDLDGFPAGADCNDNDPEVNPGQTEIPLNLKDDDCDPRTPDLLAQCGVEVVFLMDTSGSMNDDAAALCSRISQVQADLGDLGIDAQTHLWGISETRGGGFSCLTTSVTQQLGGSVPGNDGTCDGFLNQSESWGQGAAIVANRFPWTPDAIRVIVPISDEGPCNGDTCFLTGSDRDSVVNAANLALLNQAFVSPIVARGANSCVSSLATFLAVETGGTVFFSTNPDLDLAAAIADLLVGACEDTFVLALEPPVALNPPGTPHEVQARATNSLGFPLAASEVAFEVLSGPNTGALGTATTDGDGIAAFVYLGADTRGVDEIVATIQDSLGRTVTSEPAFKFWDDDCNENGTADTCDIDCAGFGGICGALPGCGTSSDLDGDGAPDDCLLPSAGTDEDDDGFPANVDCNDMDPAVNPGASEIPGNGIDDDCNPATPDTIPAGDVSCSVTPNATGYGANATIQLDVRVQNGAQQLSMVGLAAVVDAVASDGTVLIAETRPLAPIGPGELRQAIFSASTGTAAPGPVAIDVSVDAGGGAVASCTATTLILNSGDRGPLLTGTIAADPDNILAGDSAVILFSVSNIGNISANPALYEVLVLDPVTEVVLATFPASESLAVGATTNGSHPMPELPAGDYMLVLRGGLLAADEEVLASNGFRVVNVPPDCSGATVDPAELWPPNHMFVDLVLDGVVDPDGDPVTLSVVSVFQDEPTDVNGSGNTCVDASGIGTATASVRRERAGGGDGRVYHVNFLADDGRGGSCEATVTVCVPHSRHSGCVDQGPLFDSTVCP